MTASRSGIGRRLTHKKKQRKQKKQKNQKIILILLLRSYCIWVQYSCMETTCDIEDEVIEPADGELLKAYMETGDRRLFDKYNGRLIAYMLSRGIQHQDAQDRAQDVWIQVFHKGHTAKNKKNLFPWLKKIAINIFIDGVRRKRPFNFSENTLDGDGRTNIEVITLFDSGEEKPCDAAMQSENGELVTEAVNALKEDWRAIISLCCIQGISNSEAAKMLDKPVNTVKSGQHRSIQRMRWYISRVYPQFFDASRAA